MSHTNRNKSLYIGDTEGGDKKDEESGQKESEECDEEIYILGTPSDEERVGLSIGPCWPEDRLDRPKNWVGWVSWILGWARHGPKCEAWYNFWVGLRLKLFQPDAWPDRAQSE